MTDDRIIFQQLDRAADTRGVVAKSTQQVIGESLINLGFGVAIVTVAVVVAFFGVKALLAHGKRRLEGDVLAAVSR